jgi:hypothetical protein
MVIENSKTEPKILSDTIRSKETVWVSFNLTAPMQRNILSYNYNNRYEL